MDYGLAAIRTIHFAATVAASGVILFRWLVAAPAYRDVNSPPQSRGASLIDPVFDRQLGLIFNASLLVVLVSGAGWLLAVATDIGEGSMHEALGDGTVWKVLTATQFGQVAILRLIVVGALIAVTWPSRRAQSVDGILPSWLPVTMTALLIGLLAWAGHSGSIPGAEGVLFLANDIVHLLAVGAWVGGLLPLALFLANLERHPGTSSLRAAAFATRRFSTLGIAAVVAIVVTGFINSCHFVADLTALVETEYGRLLTLKMVLFLAMLGLAAFNKFILSPRIETVATWRKLKRNCLIEVALGLVILAIVAVLGMVSPSAHVHMAQRGLAAHAMYAATPVELPRHRID